MEKVEKGDGKLENQMNRKLGIWIILMSLVAVAFLSGVWAWLTFPDFGYRIGFRPGGMPFPQFDLRSWFVLYVARTVLSTVNIAILSILTASYIMIYRQMRSRFTIGLVLFSSVFLMKDILGSPFVIGLLSLTLSGLGIFILLEPLLEFMALSVLLYLNLEY